MLKLIAKISVFSIVILLFLFSYTIAENTKGETKNRDIEITKGEYMGQKWYIDKNHILHWDGKPYIPHAINDFPLLNEEIDEQIKGIDFG